MAALSVDTIRAALSCIPADLPRDEWARIAMALKAELGEAGLDAFDAWSRGGQSYNDNATRSTWRSVKADGGIGIGTLIHIAKAHGYRSAAQPHNAQHETNPSAVGGDTAAAAAARAQGHAEAATEAQLAWNQASESGASPYLERKAVAAHGVRYGEGGWLFVPVRDADGVLWNLQRIAPTKPDGGPEKLFFKGGRKSGLWHWCGNPAGAPVLLIAEGYATAASLYEATGLPVAVAFDAGNLAPVAKAIRVAHPAASILLCADDDRDTEAKTGRNTGRDKARAAADCIGGAVVLPATLPEGGSDFNDMAAHAGLDAVRLCIEAAVQGIAIAGDPVRTGSPVRTDEGLQTPRPVQTEPPVLKVDDATSADARSPAAVDRFSVDARGVWYEEHDNEGRARAPLWVCEPLHVPALTRDNDGQGWGCLLTFADPAGKQRQWAMPLRMLAGDGTEFRATLMSLGLRISPSMKARNLLSQYVQTRNPEEHARCTDRVGWHGPVYVLPRETLGEGGERMVYQTDGNFESGLRQTGSLEQWQQRVARLCIGNSRLAFAVCCAFAGPMLHHANIDSGGFHFRGESSCGKTTALRVAASVYGGASFVQRWRATDNALEAIAAQHSDGLLILDELAQVDPKTAGECAYMLANEQSKARSTRTGQPRPRLKWRLVFLSAGEIGLAQHMAEGDKRARAGQELRMADIPADAGAGLGIFEELHGHDLGATLAHELGKACDAQHGTAGRAFLEWAVAHADTLRERLRSDIDRLAELWIPRTASGQVQRVGRRFAVVAVAGELATEAGLTGWPEGEATRASKTCFDSWLQARGGLGNAEDAQMLAQVRRFLETHGEGRFTDWNRGGDDIAPRTLQRAGYRRALKESSGEVQGWDFYVFIETFRVDVCQGFDYKAVLRALGKHGHLQPDKGRPFDCRARLPGLGPTACYRIASSILSESTE